MQIFPLRFPLKSANSLRRLRAPEIGHKNGFGFMETWRFYGTSEGYGNAESVSQPIQRAIVDALHSGDRNRALYLLSELRGGSHPLQAQDFILILQYCAKTPDPLFVMETRKLMEEKEVEFSGSCYFLTIRALCKGGYLEEALNIVSFLNENSEESATLPMYNNLLGACVQMHSLNYANKCLHLMERQGLGKNEITYALLLKLAVLQDDLSTVKKILKECVNFYSPSILTLRRVIWTFTRLRDLESAYAALQQMVAIAFRDHISITKTAEGKLYDSRLDIPVPCCDKLILTRFSHDNKIVLPFDAEEFRDGGTIVSQKPISGPVTKLLRWSFNDIIATCASMQNLVLAEKLMSQMKNLGLKLSSNTYNAFIRALVSVKGFRHGMEVLKVMQEKNMKPYDSTLAAISTSCSRGLELDWAEMFLDQMSQCPYTYPFNAFLEACDTLDRPERALQVFAKMKRLNILPDIRTYELLFSLFGNVNAPYEDGNMLSQVDVANRIHAIEMDMIRHGIPHSHLSMQNLLKALGTEGMVKELIQYLRVAEDQLSHGSTYIGMPIYNTVLHSLVEAKESGVAIEIFRTMISYGYSVDAATYDIMIDCCSNIRCYRSACGLVSMMIRDGFCPNVVTYTALIKNLLKLDRLDEVIKLLEQCSSDGIQPDVLLYNTILQGAGDKGRIDVIEFIITRMQQEKIQPEPSTCSHVFSAYVDEGLLVTAMEALQVLSLRMISLEEDILEENRLEYENLIYSEDLEAESHIIEIFKDGVADATDECIYCESDTSVNSPILVMQNQPTPQFLDPAQESSVIHGSNEACGDI
ncbi:pentatricopeptide repeat-containing protein [Dorcoceras hygrometricum]|uniref:Pentatricopeptide repeat-containing protein n=1 Tax=Dorcoceras hygrometricum TaxID=472368 RepID=A0A2Z7BG00_9LAMI|nr:pentatricopeptide repeat-containing protein [Dorcoceras hygrometricum]